MNIPKFKGIYILLIVALVATIVLFTSPKSAVPYSRDTLFSNMYKYEGMEGSMGPMGPMGPMGSMDPNLPVDSSGSMGPMGPPQLPPPPLSQMPPPPTADQMPPVVPPMQKKDPKMVEGFALQSSPYGDYKSLDIFSQASGDAKCFGKSSGYSNSMGPLCFDTNQTNALMTRGFNMSGSSCSIGK